MGLFYCLILFVIADGLEFFFRCGRKSWDRAAQILERYLVLKSSKIVNDCICLSFTSYLIKVGTDVLCKLGGVGRVDVERGAGTLAGERLRAA